MLAALDTCIEKGTGGRTAVVLKQACALFLRVGIDNTPESTTLFDEMMANIAMGLDEDSVALLAPEVLRLSGVLPSFAGVVLERSRQAVEGRDGAPAVKQVQDLIELEFADTAVTPAEPAAEAVASTPPRALVERRTRERDPVEDASNPLTLARRASPEELEAIAAMPSVPEVITGILASRGHRPAIAASLANPGAVFSRSTLTMLAELAPSDRDLRNGLAARHDLPEAVVDKLMPVIGREARARLLMSGRLISVEDARSALAAAEADLMGGSRRGAPQMSIDMLAAGVKEERLTIDDVVELLAAEVRLPELAAFATSIATAGYHPVYAMLCARLDHPSAILIRALGGTERAVSAVMDMRRKCGFRDAKEAKSAVFIFNRYAADEAKVLLKLIDEQLTEASVADDHEAEPTVSLALAG